MTAADFKAAFPAFAGVLDATIDAQIAASSSYFNLGVWGNYYTEGLGFWIAHRLTMMNVGAATPIGIAVAGDVTEKHVGSVSVGRGAVLLQKQMDNPYMRTIYGQEYLHLVMIVGTGMRAV